MIVAHLFPAGVIAATLFVRPDAPADLVIDTSALAAMPARELRAMIRETDDIWRRYGVSLHWVASAAGELGATEVITVVPDRAPLAPHQRGRRRLGAVTFVDGHVYAERSVAVSVAAIEDLVGETPWANRRVVEWPARLREELVGRALGRVLAHELGHYLLAWRQHTPDGLMRSQFRGELLVDPDRRPFQISDALRPRLNGHLEQIRAAREVLAAR
jgi:hypothetical protein